MGLKNKMDVSLSIAVGSATQVAMFVVSLAIIVGWIIDLPLSLAFDPFEINLFIYSSIIIFATISDGSSNWLEGVMLLGLYALIAIAVYIVFFFVFLFLRHIVGERISNLIF